MKFVFILSAVALIGVLAVTPSEASVVVPESDRDDVVISPVHTLQRVKRVTCDIGGFACNLHCQFQGYAKGKCSTNVCRCSDYSG